MGFISLTLIKEVTIFLLNRTDTVEGKICLIRMNPPTIHAVVNVGNFSNGGGHCVLRSEF